MFLLSFSLIKFSNCSKISLFRRSSKSWLNDSPPIFLVALNNVTAFAWMVSCFASSSAGERYGVSPPHIWMESAWMTVVFFSLNYDYIKWKRNLVWFSTVLTTLCNFSERFLCYNNWICKNLEKRLHSKATFDIFQGNTLASNVKIIENTANLYWYKNLY